MLDCFQYFTILFAKDKCINFTAHSSVVHDQAQITIHSAVVWREGLHYIIHILLWFQYSFVFRFYFTTKQFLYHTNVEGQKMMINISFDCNRINTVNFLFFDNYNFSSKFWKNLIQVLAKQFQMIGTFVRMDLSLSG